MRGLAVVWQPMPTVFAKTLSLYASSVRGMYAFCSLSREPGEVGEGRLVESVAGFEIDDLGVTGEHTQL